MEILTREKAEAVMKERGYVLTASANSGAIYFFSKKTPVGPLSAEVRLESQQISLSFVDLAYFCQLKADRFDFHHRDFEKYENIIFMYAQKCKDIDPLELLNKPNDLILDSVEKKPKKSLEERKKEFWEKVREKAKGKYTKEMAVDFYNHWTEHNENGRMLRFEKEDTFSLEKRLATWAKNEEKFNKNRKTFSEKKAEEQTAALKEAPIQIDKNTLF